MLFINVSISQYATGPSLNTQEDSNQAKFFLLDCVSRVNSITSCFILMIYSSSFLFSLLDEDLGRNIYIFNTFYLFFLTMLNI